MAAAEHPHPTAAPQAAAVAGVVFSLLLSTTRVIIRLAAPDYQTDPDQWLANPVRRNTLRFAIQLAPFAAIAFLWFIGVLRNRLGSREDQFFATVFLGSGFLFIATLFATAALAGAVIRSLADESVRSLSTDAYHLARQCSGSIASKDSSSWRLSAKNGSAGSYAVHSRFKSSFWILP